MSSKIAVWAQDRTPQDNHRRQAVAAFVVVAAGSYNHRILPVVEVERTQELELAPGTAVAVVVVDTVVAAAAAGTLEEREPRPVHHTPVVGELPTDKRQAVVPGCQQLEPVVPRDRPRWDSRQEPTLR